MTPDAGVDAVQAARLAEKALRKDAKDHFYRGWTGATSYRAGRFKEAARRLQEAAKVHGQGGTAWDLLWLAMVHHRLGTMERARECLDRAVRWMEQAEQGTLKDPVVKAPLAWNQQLELQLLKREAQALFNGVKP